MILSQAVFWSVHIVSWISYCALLFFCAISQKDKPIRACIFVLALYILWTVSSLLMKLQVAPGVLFWNRVAVTGLALIPFGFFYFISVYTETLNVKKSLPWLMGTVGICVLNIMGYVVKKAQVLTRVNTVDGYQTVTIELQYVLGWGAVLVFIYICLILLATLFKGFRDLEGGSQKARGVKLIFAGYIILFVAVALSFTPTIGKYPVDILAGFVNAVFMMVAIYKYRMIELQFAFKKGVVSLFFMGLLTIVYIYAAFLAERTVKAYYPSITGYTLPLTIIVLMVTFLPFYKWIGKITDKMFYTTEYEQRQWLREFSLNMANNLNLSEIAGTLLETVRNVFCARQVYLALYSKEEKGYALKRTAAKLSGRHSVISEDSPLVRWFEEHTFLTLKNVQTLPLFKAMWDSETQLINEIELEIAIPLRSRNKLIGMLILSKKNDNSSYTLEDVDLLTSLGTSTAVAIDSARIYEKAQDEANTDSLTGLHNHRYFCGELRKQIMLAPDQELSLIMLDLDMFKLYNDLYTHFEGDRALETVARILMFFVGKKGTVARYGGEEFAIILPQYDSKQAAELAEKIRLEVQMAFYGATGFRKRFLTISAGICTFPTAAPNSAELLKRAEIALYLAKDSGKNRVVIYTPSAVLSSEKAAQSVEELRMSRSIETTHASTIFALTATIETKDYYTFGHSQKVAEYASILASSIGFDGGHIKLIVEAALLHDIGKIGIPEDILKKKGRLTKREFEAMKRHVDMSATIIKHLPSLQYVLPAVVGHHEYWNGKGYPYGTAGEGIAISARCLAIADAFDAMVSNRPYREACSVDYALRELRDNSNSQFDPFLANTFVKLIETGGVTVALRD